MLSLKFPCKCVRYAVFDKSTLSTVRYPQTFMRVAFLCSVLLASSLWAQPNIYAIKAARLFDGTNDKLIQPGVIVVAGNKIQSIGGSIPPNATVIDLGDATLLPGFIDSHTHLTMDFDPDYNGARLREMERTIPEQRHPTLPQMRARLCWRASPRSAT